MDRISFTVLSHNLSNFGHLETTCRWFRRSKRQRKEKQCGQMLYAEGAGSCCFIQLTTMSEIVSCGDVASDPWSDTGHIIRLCMLETFLPTAVDPR